MAVRVKPLRRTGSTGQPNIANMQEGEIAVNSYDQKIWMRVGSNLVEIANAGGSVTWGDVSGKPATATRWPTWNEVTGKPSTFAPSSHTHTVTDVSGLGTAATRNTGTSGANIPLLDGSNVWSGNHAFQSRLRISGNSVSWGAGAHADQGIKVDMGTASAATWLIEGYSGSTRRYGIQGYDPGGRMRLYDGTSFAELTAGVWSEGSIPSLNASKITAGTFAAARIPNLNASKITAGTLNEARIPTLARSKVSGLGDGDQGKLRITVSDRWVDIGPHNTSRCHFYTSVPTFYFDKTVDFNGEIRFYNGPRVPRTFVQPIDPGSSAEAGDLWIW